MSLIGDEKRVSKDWTGELGFKMPGHRWYLNIDCRKALSFYEVAVMLNRGYDVNDFEYRVSEGQWHQLILDSEIGVLVEENIQFRFRLNMPFTVPADEDFPLCLACQEMRPCDCV